MVYFAVGELALDGGVMVTASHNPKEYTGMKIVRAGRVAGRRRLGLDGDTRSSAGRLTSPRDDQASPRGRHLARYVLRVLSFVDLDEINPLKVVIDAANGMAGVMLPPILERLPSRSDPLLLRA